MPIGDNNIFLFLDQSKDLFLSEYLDDLLVVPELGQVQGVISFGVPEAEVNTLILEEPDNVHITLIGSLHHWRELESAALWCRGQLRLQSGPSECPGLVSELLS